MEEVDFTKIYTNTGAEYTGGVNFLNGKRDCPDCKDEMVRIPEGQPFINTKNGKILVNISQTNGKMLICNLEPDYIWKCKKCSNALSVQK